MYMLVIIISVAHWPIDHLRNKVIYVALLYSFTSVYTNFPSCMWDESKTSFPIQEGI